MWPNFTVNLCISLHLNIYFLYKGKEGMIENLEKYLQYSYLVLSVPRLSCANITVQVGDVDDDDV